MTIQNSIPHVEWITPDLARLAGDWHCYFTHEGFVYRLTVFKGFLYDGATVPRIGTFLFGISKDGVHRSGTLWHDHSYFKKGDYTRREKDYQLEIKILVDGKEKWRECAAQFSRKDCDEIFIQIIKSTKGIQYENRKLKIMYRAVRLFGWWFWSLKKRRHPKWYSE